MTTPEVVLTALRDHDVRVVETDGWRLRGYASLTPVGQVNHHTAVRGPCSERTAAAMIRGRRDLSGPLCNAHGGLDADGRPVLFLIAWHRARHAGRGSAVVLGEILAARSPSGDAKARDLEDDTDGNRRFWGWEWQHPGDASPWTDPFLDLVGRANAALAEVFGWPPERSIHHREWTRRKIDMSWRGDLRELVADHLAPPPPQQVEDHMPVIARVEGQPTVWLTDLLTAKRSLDNSAEVSALVAAGVRDVGAVPPELLADVPAVRG